MKVQFILKKNHDYGFSTKNRRSSGLWNSTRFIAEALECDGIDCDIVEVVDNNAIDKEVSRFNPDLCIIEALWVVPEKFDVLKKLHPKVRWFVHLHSNIPFLAMEGMAVKWLYGYGARGVKCIANSEEAFKTLKTLLGNMAVYLPNVYINETMKPVQKDRHGEHIDVACLGAIRPLKNQLIQAMTAIRFSREIGKRLRFHINGGRVETGGESVLKNLRSLFAAHCREAELVEHPWFEPHELLIFLAGRIDIGMQISLSETFNVVTADYLSAGLPIVVSKEIGWVSNLSIAQDDDSGDIVRVMHRAWDWRWLIGWNQGLLASKSKKSAKLWFEYVRLEILRYCR